MPDQLPLLVFPQRRTIQPEAGRPAFSPPPHLPNRARQIERFGRGLNTLQQSWAQYRASLSDGMLGVEPETVLVIEIVGRVDDFRAAVESAGLDWLGEWDQLDIEPDEDFYAADEEGRPKASSLSGRLFLSMANERGMRELLSLWEQWGTGRSLPRGKSAWGKVFERLRTIRRWGPHESLEETGMLNQWRAFLEASDDPAAIDRFQVEFFYHSNQVRRQRNELQLRETLGRLGGTVIGSPIDIGPIAFHAMKGELPRAAIEELVREVSGAESDTRIDLLKLSSIMFFRPTGQSLAVSSGEEGQPGVVAGALPDLEPVAALFDGVPLQQHDALLDRLDVDDVFGLEPLYQPGERKHGTAMASLIVHGDTGGGVNDPLRRRLLCIPVMQPDLAATGYVSPRPEHMPDDVFFEDRIQIAVRRMFEGANGLQAQAPQIKVINLSIGDRSRLLAHTLSPWARLLDWLSYEYRVLFCVSAGNYTDDIQMGLPHTGFSTLPDDQKVEAALKAMQQGLADRRVMSPAESMNALTVGALHADEFGPFPLHRRVDVMPCEGLPSPAMRLGHGFRRSVKPEILLAGGRQLYKDPIQGQQTAYQIDPLTAMGPGQKVATDSTEPGKRSNFGYGKGTSNATALATRGAVRIHDMLQALREQQGQDIPDGLMAVLMKALLVHGARQPEVAKAQLESALKTSANSRQFRAVLARYLGYGAADIERVLACTEQRATVLGCDEIRENEIHEYEFPLPVCMSGQRLWRRLVVTLAWFTPINPAHRNLREAKLELAPAGSNWRQMPLRLDRVDADHNQMLRGTVQHEVLESKNDVMAFQYGDVLRLRVHCKRDGVERLDRAIPYGLAVTLEVKQDLPIYQQIKARVAAPLAVRPPV